MPLPRRVAADWLDYRGSGGVRLLACGHFHTLVVPHGAGPEAGMWATGSNREGQCGLGSAPGVAVATGFRPVDGGPGFCDFACVSAGASHSVAVTMNFVVYG